MIKFRIKGRMMTSLLTMMALVIEIMVEKFGKETITKKLAVKRKRERLM
jgi:hypothetical protein